MSTGKQHEVEQEQPEGEQQEAAPEEQPSLESELAAAIAERDANYDRWLRAQAEIENLRKRAQREAEETRKYAALPLVRELLPGLDNLARAITAAKSTQNCDELIQGIELVYKQFTDVLARHGVISIEAAGQPFDPNRHEAIQQVPSAAHEPMTVLDEAERGYLLHDRVVRPSRVVVSAAPPSNSETDNASES